MAISTANFSNEKGQSLSPSSFKIKKLEITNHKGIVRDITNIVVSFSITESLYTPSLIANFKIKDVNNFFEDFPIIGQEKINIVIEKKNIDNEATIDLDFIVTEYPLFGRAAAQHTQVYTLNCISPFAYISNLKKISKSFDDLTSVTIQKIYENDLGEELIIDEKAISRAKGVIPTMDPLKACGWLKSKTFDNKQSPYYLYQTLSGVCQLTSHYTLTQAAVYESYVDGKDYNQEPQTSDEYRQRARRILELASDLKLGKMFQSMDGAFSSSNKLLDVANKTYLTELYTYKDIQENLGKSSLSSTFKVDGKTLDKINDSHLEHISINSQAYDGEFETLNDMRKTAKGKPKGYLENFETFNHDIKLFGDFKLNAGRKINLKFPKTCDPEVQKQILKENKNDYYDKHLSGDYIITSVVHIFEDGEHYSNVRVKRDSFSIDL
jgi:hypothetical protein